MVLAFHGAFDEPRGHRAESGLDALADARGLIVAYPEGIGADPGWNAGICVPPGALRGRRRRLRGGDPRSGGVRVLRRRAAGVRRGLQQRGDARPPHRLPALDARRGHRGGVGGHRVVVRPGAGGAGAAHPRHRRRDRGLRRHPPRGPPPRWTRPCGAGATSTAAAAQRRRCSRRGRCSAWRTAAARPTWRCAAAASTAASTRGPPPRGTPRRVHPRLLRAPSRCRRRSELPQRASADAVRGHSPGSARGASSTAGKLPTDRREASPPPHHVHRVQRLAGVIVRVGGAALVGRADRARHLRRGDAPDDRAALALRVLLDDAELGGEIAVRCTRGRRRPSRCQQQAHTMRPIPAGLRTGAKSSRWRSDRQPTATSTAATTRGRCRAPVVHRALRTGVERDGQAHAVVEESAAAANRGNAR